MSEGTYGEEMSHLLGRLKAEAEGKAEAYQQMGWFLQQAIELPPPHCSSAFGSRSPLNT